MNEKDPAFDREKFNKAAEGFLQEADRYRAELQAKEDYLEKRNKPLPEKLFHVTTRESADQIIREGLDPSRLMFSKDEVVSLSDDIDFAKNVVQETQKTAPGNLVVLEIDTRYLTPSRVRNYLRAEDKDNPKPIDAAAIHEVHYDSYVPPEAIKIIEEKKKES